MNYAVVDQTGLIVNRVVLGDDEWDPGEGLEIHHESEGGYQIGGTLIDGVYTPPPDDTPTIDLPAYVMDRRDELVDGGVSFNGVEFQTRATDRENIMGASQLALMAIINGAQSGDLRWANPDADFAWIAMDNSMVPMDAQTVIAFGQTAAARKQTLIMTARAIKDAIESGAITTTAEIDAAFG